MATYTTFPEVADVYYFRAPTRYTFGTSRILPNTLYVEIMLAGRVYYNGVEYRRGTVFCHAAGQSTLHDFPEGKPYRVLMMLFQHYNRKRWNFPHISSWRHMESLDFFVHDALEDFSAGVAKDVLSASLFSTLWLNIQPQVVSPEEPERMISKEVFNARRELGRLDREISWRGFAQYYANYNPEYLRKLFQKQFQVTPAQYRLQHQIAAACRLLRETGMTVAEIARETRFKNIETFYRAFRRLMNCTPLQYRRNPDAGGNADSQD